MARAPRTPKPASAIVSGDIVVDEDGLATMIMLTSMSGPVVSVGPNDTYRCDPAEALRLRDAGFAEQRAA